MMVNQKRAEYRMLFKQNVERRLLVDKIVRSVVVACVIIAIIPLGSILLEVFRNGAAAISIEFLTQTPGAAGAAGVEELGGVGHAIQGTLILIGLASLIGVPIGVLSGIFLSEFGDMKLANYVRFYTDVFTEFPSIVIGIFAFLVIVLVLGHFSPLAGAFALSLIMFPVVARTTEESLKLVPLTYREAGLSLGLTKFTITTRIIISAAKSGMITGILLAVSRIGGETAPLIMTILGSSQFFHSFDEPMDALPLRIWRFSLLPYESSVLQGWGSALVLIFVILAINLAVRYYVFGKRINIFRLFAKQRTGKKI
jgi:phosphate transport system permease protein